MWRIDRSWDFPLPVKTSPAVFALALRPHRTLLLPSGGGLSEETVTTRVPDAEASTHRTPFAARRPKCHEPSSEHGRSGADGDHGPRGQQCPGHLLFHASSSVRRIRSGIPSMTAYSGAAHFNIRRQVILS